MADNQSRTGTGHGTPAILRFVEKIHAPHDEGLARAFQSPEQTGIPAIQLAASEGKLLHLLLRLVSAGKVVEIGTLAGYSAIQMARAMPEDGRLVTIESDPRHAEIAAANVSAAGLSHKIRVLTGEGREVLPGIEPDGPFDAVFIDADKRSYDNYGRWAAGNLRRGGLLLADNVFLFGKLLEEGEEAEVMRRFHREAAAAFDSVCIPTPEGMLLGVKR